MASTDPRPTGGVGFLNRLHARIATRARSRTSFRYYPEPRGFGQMEAGKHLLSGDFLFAGSEVSAPGKTPWQIEIPDAGFSAELQSFAWLEALAALGDKHARATAQEWTLAWIARFGRGGGPGWTPRIAGLRVLRLCNHAEFVMRDLEADDARKITQSLGRHVLFLSRRSQGAPGGLPRLQALAGLIAGASALRDMARFSAPAQEALRGEIAATLQEDGAIASRNPEELLEVSTLLTWSAMALEEAGGEVPATHVAAIRRIAPVLRSLRHADGTLARFQGGGRGPEGRLDRMLAASGVTTASPQGRAMGYARLSAGRTSVILDASPPQKGRDSHGAHASTLAFELTSGRRPVVVSCGSGHGKGSDWRRAGRSTPSHSVLVVDGTPSSAFAGKGDTLDRVPEQVPVEMEFTPDGSRFQGGHDGYVKEFGLTHARMLDLTFDGRAMAGEDMLLAVEDKARKRFDRALEKRGSLGIPYKIRFHLHPDVEVAQDVGDGAIRIALPNGEAWHFRFDGQVSPEVEASVYLEKDRIRPRSTKQLVLSGRAMGYATRIRWSFAKTRETPVAIRDLAGIEEEDPLMSDMT